jgi:hypothetical protein
LVCALELLWLLQLRHGTRSLDHPRAWVTITAPIIAIAEFQHRGQISAKAEEACPSSAVDVIEE